MQDGPAYNHCVYMKTATDFYSNLLCIYVFHSFSIFNHRTYTSALGYWHQRADERHGNPRQGNQELLVVRDKVGRPQVSLG